MTVANPKKVGRVVLISLAVLLVGNLGRVVYRSSKPIRAQAASGTPYTVVRTESGFDKAGTLRYTNKYVEARRGDDSTMWSATTSVVQQRRIYFANGDEVLTNELLSKKSTYPKKFPEGPHGLRDPQASCYTASDSKIGWVIDGQETIAGHPAVRLRFTRSKRTMTEWYALDVGCALLQSRLEHEEGVTVQSLAALTVGEPATTLFQVPDTLQETPPSGQYEPICVNGTCTSISDERKQRMDKNYYALRAKTP